MSVNQQKSVVGLRDLYIAEVTQDDADAYAAETPVYFAPAVNASQAPTTNSQTQFADDAPFDVMTAEGSTTIEIEVTAIPLAMQAKVLGKGYDAVNGRLFDNGGTPPDIALSFRSLKSNGKYKYFQYLKGKFGAPTEETATRTDTPDPKTAKITFTAVKTVHQFDLGDFSDSVKRVVGDEDIDGFSGAGWFEDVQVPVSGSPSAFSVSSSTPTDGATAVAVASNITINFSNPLAGNAENGIILTTAAGVPVACARTVAGDRTSVVLDPNSNLSTSTDYLVVLAGVKDVYGQALATTVIDFETDS